MEKGEGKMRKRAGLPGVADADRSRGVLEIAGRSYLAPGIQDIQRGSQDGVIGRKGDGALVLQRMRQAEASGDFMPREREAKSVRYRSVLHVTAQRIARGNSVTESR